MKFIKYTEPQGVNGGCAYNGSAILASMVKQLSFRCSDDTTVIMLNDGTNRYAIESVDELLGQLERD